MTDLYAEIARQIKRLRTQHRGRGISQEALALALGTTANTVSRWETGTYKPSAAELEKLARFFGVSITVFFPSELAGSDDRTQRLAAIAQQLPEPAYTELVGYAEYKLQQVAASAPLSGPIRSASEHRAGSAEEPKKPVKA